MKTIPFTKPLVPDKEELFPYIVDMLNTGRLTNDGPNVTLLERRLRRYLEADYLSIVNNGTTALMIALSALGINIKNEEIIVSPFTFPATIHAIAFRGIAPIFCDIEEETWNIDTNKIKQVLTTESRALIGVHVFGNPCQTDEIYEIAKYSKIKIIYDASHAFGVREMFGEGEYGFDYSGFGDASILSFHASKLFNTCEGGAIVTPHEGIKKLVDQKRNFGLGSFNHCNIGINGKMSEVHAAFGLVNLKKVDEEIEKREKVAEYYINKLVGNENITFQKFNQKVKRNYQYFPIRISNRDELFQELVKDGIESKMYFYPLCSNYPCYRHLPSAKPQNLPVANKIAQEVLCLPIYGDLEEEDIERICKIVLKVVNKGKPCLT